MTWAPRSLSGAGIYDLGAQIIDSGAPKSWILAPESMIWVAQIIDSGARIYDLGTQIIDSGARTYDLGAQIIDSARIFDLGAQAPESMIWVPKT